MFTTSFTPSPLGVNGFGEARGANTSELLKDVLTARRSLSILSTALP